MYPPMIQFSSVSFEKSAAAENAQETFSESCHNHILFKCPCASKKRKSIIWIYAFCHSTVLLYLHFCILSKGNFHHPIFFARQSPSGLYFVPRMVKPSLRHAKALLLILAFTLLEWNAIIFLRKRVFFIFQRKYTTK